MLIPGMLCPLTGRPETAIIQTARSVEFKARSGNFTRAELGPQQELLSETFQQWVLCRAAGSPFELFNPLEEYHGC